MKNLRNGIKRKFIEKDDDDLKSFKKSKLTFNGILESYTKNDSYAFKQSEVPMDT